MQADRPGLGLKAGAVLVGVAIQPGIAVDFQKVHRAGQFAVEVFIACLQRQQRPAGLPTGRGGERTLAFGVVFASGGAVRGPPVAQVIGKIVAGGEFTQVEAQMPVSVGAQEAKGAFGIAEGTQFHPEAAFILSGLAALFAADAHDAADCRSSAIGGSVVLDYLHRLYRFGVKQGKVVGLSVGVEGHAVKHDQGVAGKVAQDRNPLAFAFEGGV